MEETRKELRQKNEPENKDERKLRHFLHPKLAAKKFNTLKMQTDKTKRKIQ